MDRYLMISREYPVYMKMQTKSRMYLYIVVIWGCGFLNGAIELILWDKVDVPVLGRDPFEYTQDCRSPPKHTFLYFLITFGMNIFFPLIEAFCIMFVIKLRKRLKQRARVGDMSADNTRTDRVTVPGQHCTKISTKSFSR